MCKYTQGKGDVRVLTYFQSRPRLAVEQEVNDPAWF